MYMFKALNHFFNMFLDSIKLLSPELDMFYFAE